MRHPYTTVLIYSVCLIVSWLAWGIYGYTQYEASPFYSELQRAFDYALFYGSFTGWLVAMIMTPISYLLYPDHKPGCCKKCGYDLHGSSGACPECGSESGPVENR